MKLSVFRDKFLSFILPLLVATSIIAGSIWTVCSTYFWDISHLTLRFNEPSQVTIRLEAEFIDTTVNIFGFPYHIYLSLPWSRRIACEAECLIERIPPGKGFVAVSNGEKTESINIVVARDTAGTLDLRSPWKIQELPEKILENLRSKPLSEQEKDALGPLIFKNTLEGLYGVVQSGRDMLYDVDSKQLLSLPMIPIRVFRGPLPGNYYIVTKESIYFYDRYGREATRSISEIVYQDLTLRWDRDTTFVYKNHTEVFPGIWVPFPYGEKPSFTDGERVMEILE